MFKNKKNQLDEMQEQKLLHIESKGFWFVWWALLASTIIQTIVYKDNPGTNIVAEWIIFMCSCLYIGGACLKAGIWDRRLKADAATNAILSVIAGVIAGVINGVVSYIRYQKMVGSIATAVFVFAFSTVICFVAISIVAKYYKKRLDKMEEEPQEE